MQLIININLHNNLDLPIAHHHILQSALYASFLTNNQLGNIHDEGVKNGKRDYKLFTFGPLQGHYSIRGKRIVFDGNVQLEVRSCYEQVIRTMAKFFKQNGIRFGDTIYQDVDVQIQDRHITDNDIAIKMIAPICAHKTDENTNHTRYFNPNEIEFYQYVEKNFVRKYKAYYGIEPDGGISFSKIKVDTRDKYVTKYKDFVIEGYRGQYRLTGDDKYLDYLYQVGLGEKNSQGFGMFEIM